LLEDETTLFDEIADAVLNDPTGRILPEICGISRLETWCEARRLILVTDGLIEWLIERARSSIG
jgi:hypothetical protein